MNPVNCDSDLPEHDEYDPPWKEAVDNYFPKFIAFYFPDAYVLIDWTEEPIFLDQELRAQLETLKTSNNSFIRSFNNRSIITFLYSSLSWVRSTM